MQDLKKSWKVGEGEGESEGEQGAGGQEEEESEEAAEEGGGGEGEEQGGEGEGAGGEEEEGEEVKATVRQPPMFAQYNQNVLLLVFKFDQKPRILCLFFSVTAMLNLFSL